MGPPLVGHRRCAAGLIRARAAHPILSAVPPSQSTISSRAVDILPLRSGRTAGRVSSRRRLAMALGAVVVGWIAYAVYAQTAAGHSLDGRIHSLQQENARLQRQIDQRRREIAAAGSPAWLEEEARRLGYVKPGERVFVLATPGAALPAEGGIDVPQLPSFAATPSPGVTPTATPTPLSGDSTPAPTPFFLSVTGASPPPH